MQWHKTDLKIKFTEISNTSVFSDLKGERSDRLPHIKGLSDRSLSVLLSYFRGEVWYAAGEKEWKKKSKQPDTACEQIYRSRCDVLFFGYYTLKPTVCAAKHCSLVVYGITSSKDKSRLQRIICSAWRMIGCNLLSLQVMYASRNLRRAG